MYRETFNVTHNLISISSLFVFLMKSNIDLDGAQN